MNHHCDSVLHFHLVKMNQLLRGYMNISRSLCQLLWSLINGFNGKDQLKCFVTVCFEPHYRLTASGVLLSPHLNSDSYFAKHFVVIELRQNWGRYDCSQWGHCFVKVCCQNQSYWVYHGWSEVSDFWLMSSPSDSVFTHKCKIKNLKKTQIIYSYFNIEKRQTVRNNKETYWCLLFLFFLLLLFLTFPFFTFWDD